MDKDEKIAIFFVIFLFLMMAALINVAFRFASNEEQRKVENCINSEQKPIYENGHFKGCR